MNSIIKRVLAALSLAALCLTASSCQLSEMLGKDTTDTSAGDTTPSDTTAGSGADTEAVEAMDFSTVDVLQYITLGQYKGLEAVLKVEQVTEEMVETELQNIVAANGSYEQITDRATAEGDTLNINFRGFLDGVQFQGGTADGQSITLSDQSGYIDGFADGLVGVMPGTTVTLDLTFPDPYSVNPDMAGKAVVFEVDVNYIRGEYIDAELSDAFVVTYTGGDLSTVAELRSFVQSKLEKESSETAKETAISDVWAQAVENAEVISYPQQQLDYYCAAQKSQCEYYANAYGMSVESVMQILGYTEESFLEDAKTYTKEDLVFYGIAQVEGVSVSDEEYTAGLANYASEAGAEPEELEDYYGELYIRECLLWDKLLEMIYDMSNITEE